MEVDTVRGTSYYIHGIGLMAMVTDTGNVYTYHFNAVGSTVAMTDSSQTVVNKYSYDSFGKILSEQETVSQPFKFVGQYGVMTEPNGFYYMRARYYDPSVGRFISEDPIGFEGGDVNLCAYAGNQPVNRIDPNGLTWGSNLNFFLDWASGGGSNSRTYGANTVQTQEMQSSPGASALRNAFYVGGGQNIDKTFAYGSGQAAWDYASQSFYCRLVEHWRTSWRLCRSQRYK